MTLAVAVPSLILSINQFEALKETRFLVPQSEPTERSEVKCSAASVLDMCSSCRFGCLSKDVE